MGSLSEAIWETLAEDSTLAGLLSSYGGKPAIFTVDPAPGDAVLPYIISAGEAVNEPFDTKTTRGREIIRDIRCYSESANSSELIEEIADRVRVLFHRVIPGVEGFTVWVSGVSGPVAFDEAEALGRILSIRLLLVEN